VSGCQNLVEVAAVSPAPLVGTGRELQQHEQRARDGQFLKLSVEVQNLVGEAVAATSAATYMNCTRAASAAARCGKLDSEGASTWSEWVPLQQNSLTLVSVL
jgi:hypothetical protein